MNWKGYLVLGLIVLGIGGFFGQKIVADKIQEQQFRAAEARIELAVHNKLDVTDIELDVISGGEVLVFYLYSEGENSNPLTAKEWEDVDTEFANVVTDTSPAFVVWTWVRPDGEVWFTVVMTVCDAPLFLANRANRQVAGRCETRQSYSPLETKHLRWLNE